MMRHEIRTIMGLLSAVLLILVSGCVTVQQEPVDLQKLRAVVASDLDAGWDHLWNNRFEEAEGSFRSALNVENRLPETYRGLGLALYARGDYFQAAEMFIAAIEANPVSPYAVPMRDFLVSEIPFHNRIRQRLTATNELLAAQETHPWIRREGLLVLQDYFRSTDLDSWEVLQCSSELGVLREWRLLGPFSNVSGSGFDKPFIDEENWAAVDFNGTCLGIDNREIRWITPTLWENDGFVSFSDYLGSDSYSAGYAFKTFTIEQEGEFYIVFAQAGALKCWLDNELIVSDGEYRYGSEVHWIRRRLSQGEHRILIKVANRDYQAGFKFSLQPAGSDIYAYRSSATYNTLFSGSHLAGYDPLLAHLSAQVDLNGNNRESGFWLAYMLMVKGYAQESLSVAARFRELDPDKNSAYVNLARSLSYASLDKYNQARNTLVHADAELFAPSVVFLLREYSNQRRWERLETLLTEAESAFGQWYYGDLYRIWLIASRDGVESSWDEIERFSGRYPHVPELDLMLLDSEFGNRVYSRDTLLDRISQKGLAEFAKYRRVREYLDWGNYQGAYSEAGQLVKHVGASEELWNLYAQAAYFGQTRSYESMRTLISDLLRSFPYSAQLIDLEMYIAGTSYYGLQEYQRQWKDSQQVRSLIDEEKQKLKSILSRHLNLDPDDYEARNELQELNGDSSYEKLIRRRDPLAVIEEFEASEREYADDAVVVLSEDTYLFFGDGAARSYRHDIIKILSQRGIQDNSSYAIQYHPRFDEVSVAQAYTLKPDGAQIEPERTYDRLSFPGLDVGDYIVVRYTRNSRRYGRLSREIWGECTINGFYPVFRRELRLIHPDSYDLTIKYHNEEGKKLTIGKTKLENEMVESYFAATDLEAVRFEGWMPHWQDVMTWIDYSSIEGWDRIVEWYRELVEGQCAITPGIRQRMEKLIEGSTNHEQRIGAIFDFVSREIEYEDLNFMYSAYVPQEAETVLEDGYGDCKDQCALLVSLLRAAGIDACIALSTPDYSGDHFYLPSARFSHTVVMIPNDDGNVILDPTAQYFNYGDLPPSMGGTHYLPITPEESGFPPALQRVSFPPAAGETCYLVKVSPSAAGGSVQGTGIYAGSHASSVRSLLLSATPEYRMHSFGSMLQQGVPGFKLTALEAANIMTLREQPMVDFTGGMAGLLVPVGKGLYALEIPWFVHLTPALLSIGQSGNRESSIHLDQFELSSPSRQVTEVEIPAGYEVYSIPGDAEFTFGEITAGYRYKRRGAEITCERYLYVPITTVAATELEAFSSAMERIFAKEQERIILRRSGR